MNNELNFRNDRLRELRKELNYTTYKVGELLGISHQTITKWENRQAFPSRERVSQLAKIFNVQSDYLLGLTNERKSDKYLFELIKNNKDIDELLNIINSLTKEQISGILTIAKLFSEK